MNWPKTIKGKVKQMRTFTTGLLKSRIARWSAIAALLAAAAGFSLAWVGQPQYKLGGGFIGSGGGMIWTSFNTPLDPDGRTAALRVNALTYPAEMAGLFAQFGADSATEYTGQLRMINRDTAKWAFIGYNTKQGTPPQICAISMMSGEIKFTDPDNFVMTMTNNVYPGPANILGLPNADADGDGFPDPGVVPVYSFPGGGTAKRVPLP